MIEKINEEASLKFKTLSPEDKKSKGILGRLYGPIADCIRPTRNNRLYSQSLWEKIFNNPIIKEKFKNGGIFGELCHPDYEEVDMSKIAIIMPEPPYQDKEGRLVGYVDILDTPCGKIAYQLAKYGYKFGISSRGTGDIIESFGDGDEVDPDTYNLNAFDLVEIPAVESARLNFVESYNGKNSLKEGLNEAFKDTTEDEKRIMNETLKQLNIKYNPSNEVNIDVDSSSSTEVVNNKSMLSKDLREALIKNRKLEKEITTLKEKLSVSYTKEATHKELVERFQGTITKLSDSKKQVEALTTKVENLTEHINKKDIQIKQLNEKLDRECVKRKSLNESLNESMSNNKQIIENLNDKVKRVMKSKSSLEESFNRKLDEMNQEKVHLNEQIESLKKDFQVKQQDYKNKLSRSKSLIEKYQRMACESMNKYIESQAVRIGVTTNEIRNRLNENFSFEDVDNVCEDLQEYKINMSKLPISISNKNTKIKIDESKETIIPNSRKESFDDDEIDDQLMSFLD